MKSPFKRMSETGDVLVTEIRNVSDQVSEMAVIGAVAFGLVAIVAITALLLATEAINKS